MEFENVETECEYLENGQILANKMKWLKKNCQTMELEKILTLLKVYHYCYRSPLVCDATIMETVVNSPEFRQEHCRTLLEMLEWPEMKTSEAGQCRVVIISALNKFPIEQLIGNLRKEDK